MADTRGARRKGLLPDEAVRRRRVLVVDDDVFIRVYLSKLLELEKGVEVLLAATGEEALRVLACTPGVDFMITDHWMPGISGLELVETVRQGGRAFPVMLISGGRIEASRAELDALAIETVLTKPFTPAQFLEAFRQAAEGITSRV